MVWSRPGPRTGEQPLAEIRTPPKTPLARPVHDPQAGIPPQGPAVRQIPPGRFPQGSLEWLLAISSVPADPVGMPLGGATGLVETGQLILFGGSLVNTGPGVGHVNLFDGADAKGTQIISLDIPAPAVTTTVATATGAISAGAGSAALPAGATVTGFTLSFSAAPSTAGTAVLSNIAGGSLTFNIPSGQASPYTVTLPNPVPASSAGVAPTLTIAGLGTGAGTILLYGTTAATAASASVQLNIPRAGILCEIGLFSQVTLGTILGTAYIGHIWKYPFTPPGE